MATPTPRMSRANRQALGTALVLVLVLPAILIACEITDVQQPSEATQGETIEVVVTVNQTSDDANPHKGVLSVLVPEDWAFVSATYTSNIGSGDLLEDDGWADSTDIKLPAPAGMKWIGTISDVGYAVPTANTYFEATVKLKVGQKTGDFGLGYFTTSDGFATKDMEFGDPSVNTADSLMNQPITVRASTASEGGAEAGPFTLRPNSPNPFQASTTIRYALDRPASVRVAVLDLAGREVAVVEQGTRAQGEHQVTFDGSRLPAGTYLYRLSADGRTVQTRSMTLTR